jgi:ribosomal protein L37E
MEKPTVIPKGCFWAEESKKLYMERCPKCGRENYALNVSSGICTWCSWDANKPYNKTDADDKTTDKV